VRERLRELPAERAGDVVSALRDLIAALTGSAHPPDRT
jgi:hypothetical protein